MSVFQPGSYSFNSGQAQTRNFLSAVDLIKKSVDAGEAPIYGNQQLFLLSESIGGKKEVTNNVHNWFESVKIMPLIKCTVTGSAGAGLVATFNVTTTTPNNQLLNLSQSTPYPAGATNPFNVGAPIKVGDIITVPPATGLGVPTNVIKARVASVTPSSTTALAFTALPLDITESIPTLASATDIMIGGNAFGEGTAQPVSSTTLPDQKTAYLQIMKHTYSTTGTAASVRTWLDDVPFYTVKGEQDAAIVFMNKIELGFLDGQTFDNTAIQSAPATPIAMAKGLINSTIEDGGYNQSYTALNGYGIPEIKELTFNLDKETMGSHKEYMFEAGIDLSFTIDDSLAEFYKNGAITYGSFGKGEAAAATLNYNQIIRGNYSYYKKTYDAFNNSQLFGSPNFAYNQCAMVIPMKGGADAKTGENIPAINTLYLKDREYNVTDFDGFKDSSTGEDKYEVRYLTERGWQFYGLNRYAFVEVSA
jgi:hypothetical protein